MSGVWRQTSCLWILCHDCITHLHGVLAGGRLRGESKEREANICAQEGGLQ